MSSAKNWENLNITRDEVKNIAEALKNDEFRKLLVEYVEETQKPENRKKFQDEIIQLEAERGVECKFVNPEPGFVIKTSIDGVKKAFINVCSNHLIGKPISKPLIVDNNRRLSWSIPYSLSPGRDDYDKKANRCVVYDVIFNPDTLYLAKNTQQFKSLVIETAVKGVEDNFKVKLDQQNLKLLKLKYKGVASPTVIRTKTTKPVNLSEEDEELHKSLDLPEVPSQKPVNNLFISDKKPENYAIPYYVIKHRSDIDIQEYTLDRNCKINSAIPKELVIEINLPLLSTTKDVELDIKDKNLDLVCEKPVKYKLNIKLPYEVSPNGNAKFNSDKRVLTITLPVVRKTPSEKDYIREDSGVESDIGDLPNNEPKDTDNEIMKEPFLNKDQLYLLPQCDFNRENNSICLILNVKNVDATSIKTKYVNQGFHLKFTSIGSGHFPINYAFYARFNSEIDGDVNIEAWDNNVTVQVCLKHLEIEDFMWIGSSENDVCEKKIDCILDLTKAFEEVKTEAEDDDDVIESDADNRDDEGRETSPDDDGGSQDVPVIPKTRTYSEGSGDELTGCGRRSILKNRMSRSLSESCADDAGSVFPASVLYTWSESCISEQQEGECKEKKTVRFSQHIQQQTFKTNSSILGQRRKNQKKTRNKRRTLERRLSESENSEEGDEREKWTKKRSVKLAEPSVEPVLKPEADQNRKKKVQKQKNYEPQNQFVLELDD